MKSGRPAKGPVQPASHNSDDRKCMPAGLNLTVRQCRKIALAWQKLTLTMPTSAGGGGGTGGALKRLLIRMSSCRQTD